MKKLLLSASFLALSAASAMAGANVFASGLKVEGQTISFILNDAADKVVLNLSKDGQPVDQIDLGAGVKGVNAVDLKDKDIAAGEYSWSLTVSAAAVTEPVQLTDGTDENIQVSSGRGIAADNNPTSPFFGTIYTVTPGNPGQTGARTEAGVYAFNAALQPINETAYTGGIEWTGNSGPNNVDVASNGDVFICDWTDAHGGVYLMDPADPTGNFISVFAEGERAESGLVTIEGAKIHGSVQDLALYGEGENRVLYTDDEDINGGNGDFFVYNIGNLESPWNVAPTACWGGNTTGILANANNRICSDRRGGLWVSQYRWQESAENPVAKHINQSGEVDFSTGDKSVFLGSTPVGAMAVNVAGDLMAVCGSDNGQVLTVAKVAFGDDGIPSMEKLYDIPYSVYGKRPFDIVFDAADNVYVIFNNEGATGGIAAWALPKEKNEYTTPANDYLTLSTTGIDDLVSETEISYVDGVIVSPVEAEVYDASGVKVAEGTNIDTAGYAAGIYIVRAAGKVLKIAK